MLRAILLFILLFAGTSLFSQSLVSTARWATQPVHVDGNANEWSNPLNFFDAKTRLLFGIVNDSTTLYLCFQNPDEKVQSKIFRCGMKITIAVKGKIKRKATISYPLPHSGDEEAGPGHAPNMEILKSNFRMQNIMLVAEGFVLHNGMIAINDSSVIKASIDWDNENKMIYELAIPFSEIFGSNYSVVDLANELTLSVEISAMEKPHVSGSSQAPMGAAGVVGGRSMTGMNYQPNSVGKSPWYQIQEFKQKFVLAIKL